MRTPGGIISKLFLSFILFAFSFVSFAKTSDYLFKKGTFVMLAPPVVNKDYFSLEFGFVIDKKFKAWKYNYNAYVTGSLFQDSLDQKDHLRAGGLGFKGGVIIPTQSWVPLLISFSAGFAKTALHTNPFFGKDDASVSRKDMFLGEVGAIYRIEKYFLRFTYQHSSVRYFKRHTFLSLGVSY